MIAVTVFFIPKIVTVLSTSGNLWQWQFMTVFFHALFYSTYIPMFTVLDPLLEFTYHLLSSWRKFALCIQSLLCMLFLFGWPPCQVRYNLNGGLPTCLWYDSLYIRIIWLLLCLCNSCKPDMVPVSIYVNELTDTHCLNDDRHRNSSGLVKGLREIK